ncbi:MAG: GNAT family N-acetyltransferase [Trueperaceae bacterium]
MIAPEEVIGFGGIALKTFAAGFYPNLYFRFDPSSWGKGYATEMAQVTLKTGCTTLGYSHVLASVRPNNLASIKVLERLGMTKIDENRDDYGTSLTYSYTLATRAKL